jgi:hypothetical protein
MDEIIVEPGIEELIVFVVNKWEDYEGGTVQDLFKTLEGAKRFCIDYIANHPRRRGWLQTSTTSWKTGCDNLEICPMPVRD